MKHTLPFKKSHVVDLFGGTPAKVAAVFHYKDRTSINKWPETLSYRDSLMVLGALWLQELDANDQVPAPRPAREAPLMACTAGGMKTVAILFARADSIYKALPGTDVYDIDRDARTWPGNTPVVAHPPCRAWGQLSFFAKPRDDEKALAPWAVEQIRKFGGVLEHPGKSKLWPELGLPEPGAGRDKFGGWTLPINQHCFGHRAEKKTRLYIVGCAPQDIPDMPIVLGEATHVIGDSGRAGYVCRCGCSFGPKLGPSGCPDCGGIKGLAQRKNRHEVSKAEREHTPPDLAAWLVELARRCKV